MIGKVFIGIVAAACLALYAMSWYVSLELKETIKHNQSTIDDLGVVYIWLDEQGNILKAEYDNLEIEVLLKSHLLNDYCKLTPQCEEI